jgi:AAA domain
MKVDANEIHLSGGAAALRAQTDKATRFVGQKQSKCPNKKERFLLQQFAHIKLNTNRRDYLVKHLLASTGLTVIWGPPKCGKSFWAVDLGLHIALGWNYRGRRVQQALVVYIALEGQHGMPARIEAFRRYHHVAHAPFYLIMSRLNLIADAAQLIKDIKAQIPADITPGVVFIDTLNRSLVGSESKDEDMAKYLAAAEGVATKLECAVAIVHHCGIDASRPRGHTSLTGSVESQLAIRKARNGDVVVTVECAKDFPEGAEIASRLQQITVGTDLDGDDITTLVVLPSDSAPQPMRSGKRTKTEPRSIRTFREALSEALEANGKEMQVRNDGPVVRVVDSQEVRVRFYDRWAKGEHDTKKATHAREKAFQRVIRALPSDIASANQHDREWLWNVSPAKMETQDTNRSGRTPTRTDTS